MNFKIDQQKLSSLNNRENNHLKQIMKLQGEVRCGAGKLLGRITWKK